MRDRQSIEIMGSRTRKFLEEMKRHYREGGKKEKGRV